MGACISQNKPNRGEPNSVRGQLKPSTIDISQKSQSTISLSTAIQTGTPHSSKDLEGKAEHLHHHHHHRHHHNKHTSNSNQRVTSEFSKGGIKEEVKHANQEHWPVHLLQEATAKRESSPGKNNDVAISQPHTNGGAKEALTSSDADFVPFENRMEFHLGLSPRKGNVQISEESVDEPRYNSQPKFEVLMQGTQGSQQIQSPEEIQIRIEEDGKLQEKYQSPSISRSNSVSSVDSEDTPIEPTLRQKLRTKLWQQFVEIQEKRHHIPVELEFKDRRCTIKRLHGAGGIDQFILERSDFGVHPKQFMKLMEHVETLVKANKRMKKCDLIMIEQAQASKNDNGALEDIEVYASYIKSPTVLVADRIFIDAKYIWPEETTVVISSQGTEDVKEEYFARMRKEIDGLTYAKSLISAFKFLPIYEQSQEGHQEVVGTSVVFVSESDFGGSIPKWFSQRVAPKAIFEFYDEIVNAAKLVILDSWL